MKRCVILIVLALAPSVRGQEFPEPTPTGRATMNDLVRRCVLAGGLSERDDPNTGSTVWALADADRLRRAVGMNPQLLTRETCDAVLARWKDGNGEQQEAVAALLRAAAETTQDVRTRAFASYLGGLSEGTQNPAQGIEACERAADLFRLCAVPDWQAACLASIGSIRYRNKDYAGALTSYEAALPIFLASLGERHSQVGNTYRNAAAVCLALGDNTRGLEFSLKALPILRETLGERDLKVGALYEEIALFYFRRGEYDRAQESSEKALAIYLMIDVSHPRICRVNYDIAAASRVREDFTRALACYLAAEPIIREVAGEGHLDLSKCYNDIAVMYFKLSQYASSMEYHRKALEIDLRSLGKHHASVGTDYNNIGGVHFAQGDYQRALENHRAALTIFRESLGEQDPQVALSLVDMGGDYQAQGDFTRALELYHQGLAIRLQATGELHPAVAVCYNNIGTVYLSQGDDAKALEFFEKARSIHQRTSSGKNLSIGLILNNIATLYGNRGDASRALETYEEALTTLRKALGEGHPGLATTYENLAFTRYNLGDSAKALSDCEKALAIRRRLAVKSNPDEAFTLIVQARILADRGDKVRFTDVIADGNPNRLATPLNGDLLRAMELLNRACDALSESPADGQAGAGRNSLKLRPLPLSVSALLLRGELREKVFGPDIVADWRLALGDYQAATDVLDSLRQRVLVRDESRLNLGGKLSDLCPRTVGVAASLSMAEKSPDRLRVAFEAVERGTARVFVEGLGRSRAQILGRVDPARLAEESSLLKRASQIELLIEREQAKPPDSWDRTPDRPTL